MGQRHRHAQRGYAKSGPLAKRFLQSPDCRELWQQRHEGRWHLGARQHLLDAAKPHRHGYRTAGVDQGGKLKYCYNWGGFKHFIVKGETKLPPGEHQVRMEFAYAGGGLGKGGKVTLYLDGKKDGAGEVGATLAMIFSADDGCDVGKDGGSAVSPDYKSGANAFNGKVKGVMLSIAEDDGSSGHLVNPEDAIRMAMARQ
jgi:hypothetical protein